MRVLNLILSALLLVSNCACDKEAVYNSQDTDGEEIQLRVRRAAADSTPSNTSTPTPTTPTPTPPEPTTSPIPTKIFREKHSFYHVTYMVDDEITANYKRVFDTLTRSYNRHVALSTAHRRALQIKLKFKFLFYGHADISKVTIATGGFLYLSDYLHKYLTFSQYIAPLMTDFDTSIGAGDIGYADTGSAFFARWEKVHIKNQPKLGNFSFETILMKNGTIVFIYENIPVPLSEIKTGAHSLKVGISDAYYSDEDIPNTNYFTRRIIRYNSVQLMQKIVMTNAIIILHPLPTCVQQDTCSKCINANIAFDCKWCSAVERCSSGIDRLKQDWEKNSCHRVKKVKNCPAITTSTPPAATPTPEKMDPALVFLLILIVIFLVASLIGLGVWIWYAYTHPTSRSGMFFMEHRPSVMAARFSNWRRGGSNQHASDIYRVDNSTA